MRVLLVSGSLPPMRCGVGDYTDALATSLTTRRGVEVAVLSSRRVVGPGPRDYETLDGIDRWSLGSLFGALGTIRRWRPDVVHVQYPTQGYDGALPGLLPLFVRSALGVPVLETLHEIYRGRLRFPVLQVAAASGFVVVRPHFAAGVRPWFRWLLERRPLRLVPNASVLPRVVLGEDERREVRRRHGHGDADGPLLAYFGFLYPRRGVELLFETADPSRHRLVIVGARHPEFPEYHRRIVDLAGAGDWQGRASITGYLPGDEAARILAAADAVVLPFVDGGGRWNTSIRSAALQGTFVLTTSLEERGYVEAENVYYARPGDVEEMRSALAAHIGARRAPGAAEAQSWEDIAEAHLSFYRACAPDGSLEIEADSWSSCPSASPP
ncbi:MAG: glycosyltransferase [Planctomycetota bacterium]|nr:glycosyltransferase [Planctomycetota bacterium]